MKLFVVFDGPPSHESGRFLEVEDEGGAGLGPQQTGADWSRDDGPGYKLDEPRVWRLGPFAPVTLVRAAAKALEHIYCPSGVDRENLAQARYYLAKAIGEPTDGLLQGSEADDDLCDHPTIYYRDGECAICHKRTGY